mmetsp:Transcript_12364/g.24929  ORF Transcript_12364/g.24929 Transcript_12364/m.24929 type:complete len:112 (+) Transcript_12364:568-903(+)
MHQPDCLLRDNRSPRIRRRDDWHCHWCINREPGCVGHPVDCCAFGSDCDGGLLYGALLCFLSVSKGRRRINIFLKIITTHVGVVVFLYNVYVYFQVACDGRAVQYLQRERG